MELFHLSCQRHPRSSLQARDRCLLTVAPLTTAHLILFLGTEKKIEVSRQSETISLQRLSRSLYVLVLSYLRKLWPHIPLIDCASLDDGDGFTGEVRSHTSVLSGGILYGAGCTSRGEKTRFGYMDTRRAVEISLICTYTHPRIDNPHLADTCSFGVVRRLVCDDSVPMMPWDEWFDTSLCIVHKSH